MAAEPTVFVVDEWDRGMAGVRIASHDAAGVLLDLVDTSESGAAAPRRLDDGSISLYRVVDEMLIVETITRAGAGLARFRIATGTPPPAGLPEPTVFRLSIGAPFVAPVLMAQGRCGSDVTDGAGVLEITNELCPQSTVESVFVEGRDENGNEIGWTSSGDLPAQPGQTVELTLPALLTTYADWKVRARFPEDSNLDLANGGVSGLFGPDLVSSKTPKAVTHAMIDGAHVWTSSLADAPFGGWKAIVSAHGARSDSYAVSVAASASDDAFTFDGLSAASVEPLDRSDLSRPALRWTVPALLDANVGIASSFWMNESGASVVFQATFPADAETDDLAFPALPELFGAWEMTPSSFVHATSVEYRRTSLVDDAADIATSTSRGLAPEGPTAGYRVEATMVHAPIP